MSFKKFISFSVPLIVLLVTLCIYIIINKIVLNYNNKINGDYSIVMISNIPMNETKLQEDISFKIKNIIHIKRDDILKDLNSSLSQNTFKILKKRLPYFYTISLYDFPTTNQLKKIKKELTNIHGIKQVNTFSKNHDTIYSLLTLIKTIITILFFAISIFAFLIIYDNIRIWFYEHHERLTIIKLHGGSILYGAKPIIKLSLLSSIFSSILTISIFTIFKPTLDIFIIKELSSIVSPNIIYFNLNDIILIFLASLILSTITVLGIILKQQLR